MSRMSLEDWAQLRQEIRQEIVDPVVKQISEALDRGSNRFLVIEQRLDGHDIEIKATQQANAKALKVRALIVAACSAVGSMAMVAGGGMVKRAAAGAWKALSGQ